MKATTRDPGLDLVSMADAAMDGLLADAVVKLHGRVTVEGHVVSRLFEREQRATDGLAWLATWPGNGINFPALSLRRPQQRGAFRRARVWPS